WTYCAALYNVPVTHTPNDCSVDFADGPSVRDLGVRSSTAAFLLQSWLHPAELVVHDASASAVIHLRLLAVPALVRDNGAPIALERKDAALLALLAVDGPTPRARAAAM